MKNRIIFKTQQVARISDSSHLLIFVFATQIIAEDGAKRKEYYADVRNIKIDNNGSLSEYPEDFMDEWKNQLMCLMRPRKK